MRNIYNASLVNEGSPKLNFKREDNIPSECGWRFVMKVVEFALNV